VIESQINVADFRRQIAEFERDTGQEGYLLLKEMMRLLVETCYNWTAPPTAGRGAGGRQAGKKAVASDILKTTRAVLPGYMSYLLKITGGDNYISSLQLRSRTGTEYTLTNIRLDPNGDQGRIDGNHQFRRGSRGRVPGRNSPRRLNENKVFTKASSLQRYTRENQKRVGKLKSGWGPGLQSLGSTKPPGWVTAAGTMGGASGPANGTRAVEVGEFKKMRGSIYVDNRVSYFNDGGMLDRAHKQTELRMQRPMDKWLQQMVTKYNRLQGAG
jgi:hypothetical protein